MKNIAIVVLAVVLIAAGGVYFALTMSNIPKKDSTSKKLSGDACKLLAKSDIDKAFGVTFNKGTAKKDGVTLSGAQVKGCDFQQVNDGSPASLFSAINFLIEIENHKNSSNAQQFMKTTRNSEKSGDKVHFVRTEVPEVGDEAFFFQPQAPATLKTSEYMYARKDNKVFRFVAARIDGIDHDKARKAITTLAKKALD